jgi:hypothetical protein
LFSLKRRKEQGETGVAIAQQKESIMESGQIVGGRTSTAFFSKKCRFVAKSGKKRWFILFRYPGNVILL